MVTTSNTGMAMQRLEIQNTMQKKNARSIRTKAATLTAIALTLCLAGFGSAAPAATFTVTSTSDAGAGSLREAITNAQTDDVIVFDGSLDGQTISLTSYTNCLSTSEPASATCVPLATWPGTPPYVSQFGPSAFFISGKSITIDATMNGATPNGVTIARGGSKEVQLSGGEVLGVQVGRSSTGENSLSSAALSRGIRRSAGMLI